MRYITLIICLCISFSCIKSKPEYKKQDAKDFFIFFMEKLYNGRVDSVLSHCSTQIGYDKLIAEYKKNYDQSDLDFKSYQHNSFIIKKYQKNQFEEKYIFDVFVKGAKLENTIYNIIVLKENNNWKVNLTREQMLMLLENEYSVLYSLARLTCDEEIFDDLVKVGYLEKVFDFHMEFASCMIKLRKEQKACDCVLRARQQEYVNLDDTFYNFLDECKNINLEYIRKYENIIHQDAVEGLTPATKRKVSILWSRFISDFKRSTLDSCYFWANIGKEKGIKGMDSVLEGIEKFRKKKLN